MQESWIDVAKLLEPEPPPSRLPRPRLGELAGSARLVQLEGGPGAGKTMALLDLVRAAREGGASTFWLSLDELDADPATLFHYLVAGVRREIPQFGADVLALLSGDPPPPRLLWQRFGQALAAFNAREVVVALDDVHHLDVAPEIIRALGAATERLPAGLRVLLTSRTRPPLSLRGLQARGLAVQIGPAALAFDEAEVQAFLAALAPAGCVSAAWSVEAARLDGWPLGLALLTSGVGGGRPGDDVAQELFLAQHVDRRAFMVRAALLAELRADTCLEVLGEREAADELEALAECHLVWRLGDGAYRFPAYLRDFLQAETHNRIPPKELATLHAAAGAHYRRVGRVEAAITHLLTAGSWSEAATACAACFPALAARGRFAVIERWLGAFPTELAGHDPRLVLWRGHSASRAGRRKEAERLYEAALAAFAAKGDQAGELQALVRLINLALYEGDRARFGPALVRGLGLLAAGRPADRADLLLARSQAADQAGDLALAAECAEGVLAIPIDEDVEVASCHVVALLNLFTLALHRGDLGGARAWAAAVVTVAGDWGFQPYAVFGSFLLAQLHLLEGDVAAAGALLEGLPQGWPDLLDWINQASAHYMLAGYHQARGDWKAANDALTRSETLFERGGFREGKKLPLERRMWLAIQRGQPEKALEAWQPGHPASEAGGSGSLYQLALAVPGLRARHLTGDAAGALRGWAVARAELASMGARFLVARGDYYAAAAELACDEPRAARATLERARAAGYEFLERQDQRLWEELAAIATVAAPPPAASSALPPPPAAPAQAAPAPQEPAPQAPATTQLRIRLLGGFEVERGGVVIDQWPRRKAKTVLTALLLNRRGLHIQELIELIDGESAGVGAVAAMHSNIMALRKTLEPRLTRGPESRFVRSEQDRYVLAWDAIAELDVAAFERAIAAARRAPAAEAAAHDAEAVALYTGNLLDERFFLDHFVEDRERLRREAVAACLRLAGQRQIFRDQEGAQSALARAATVSPCNEEVYVAMMRFHRERGSAEHLRQAYWDCRQALKRHLGLAPSPEFEREYRELQG